MWAQACFKVAQMFRQNDPSTADARATLPDAADPPLVKALRALEAGCGMGDPAVDGAVRECCEEKKLLTAAFQRAVAKQQAAGSGGAVAATGGSVR